MSADPLATPAGLSILIDALTEIEALHPFGVMSERYQHLRAYAESHGLERFNDGYGPKELRAGRQPDGSFREPGWYMKKEDKAK